MFYSIFATPLTRVKFASYVTNFLRIWRSWVFRTGDLTLKHNFLSRETFQDVILSCHHVVLFIKTSRDYAPNYPVSFEQLGKDVCEEYFSANGSFIVNKHNYTMMDMYCNLRDMNRLQQIFADEQGPNDPKQHCKEENIWRKGHQHQIPNQFDQPDLNDFPNDEEMIKYWDLGLKEAQACMKRSGIKPVNENVDNSANVWFFHPHRIDATTEQRIYQQMWADHDNLDAVARNEFEIQDQHHQQAENIRCNYSENCTTDIIDQTSELCSCLHHIADCLQEDITADSAQPLLITQGNTVKLTVNVRAVGEVHKSTLVSLLNSSPTGVSSDRLKRVKMGSKNLKEPDINIVGNEIGLFGDIALHIKDRNKPPEYKTARVIRMRNQGRATIEYRRPVSLDDTDKYPNLNVLVNMYEKSGGHYVYSNTAKNLEFKFCTIIMKVSLEFSENQMYNLTITDKKRLDDFLRSLKVSNKS